MPTLVIGLLLSWFHPDLVSARAEVYAGFREQWHDAASGGLQSQLVLEMWL